MIIKEIDEITFDKFASNHILKNPYQTKEYGSLMKNSEFNVIYIGAYTNDTLVSASLILYKTIGMNMKYGYAPRGFLIDYFDKELLTTFTKKIKEFFIKKGFAFIKINPEVNYSIIDYNERSKSINQKSKNLITTLKELGYDKLKDNLYFESMLPKYTPVIYLKDYDITKISSYNEIQKQELVGFNIISGNEEDISTLYPLIKDNDSKTETYYKQLYKKYKETDRIDLLFIELDYNTYVKYLQKEYNYEQEKNEKINKEFHQNPNSIDLYNKKSKSDAALAKITSNIASCNNKMDSNKKTEILGGALVLKHQGRITILNYGINETFQGLDTQTYLFYKILEEYKKAGYLYADLNGITADFSETTPYKELNKFKLKFNPVVFEYIGEFDLIINKPFHQLLWSTNQIQKEFYKNPKKK